MNTQHRIETFAKLGDYLSAIDEASFNSIIDKARNENSWFTKESITSAINGLIKYLNEKDLKNWTAPYNLTTVNPKKVAVIMAGNIPLVGFHDFLSVLISGHHILIKPSSKDKALLEHLIQKLIEIEPEFNSRIAFAEQLKNFDAVIATGSDNSARYFHYYFGKYPNIIRKNRTSCAVLSGKESNEDLKTLGIDVFTYFGLGCRNVSKIYIPKNFDLTVLLDNWMSYHDIIHHHKYHNNYDYQKSILLINRNHFLDSGFVMLQENERLVSPISVVYHESYDDEGALALKLTEAKEKIQCIVGNATQASVPFGQAQSPALWDYADQVDTLKFLEGLE
jgi:hypothetical protein